MGRFSRRQVDEVLLIFFPEIGFYITDSLHVMLNPIFWENKKKIKMSGVLIFITQCTKC